MNKAAIRYFEEFKKANNLDENIKANAFQFGEDADTLASLVIRGEKTATCSLHKAYEIENEPLPEINQYDVILNTQDKPVAIIKNIDVFFAPMDEVSEEFALSEGEGDKTYKYWWDAHIKFFTEYCKSLDISFNTNDLLVCERFECVDVNHTKEN